MSDYLAAAEQRESHDAFFGSPEFIDAESGEDLTYLLEQIRGVREYECPKCGTVNRQATPGKCWRCYL